jgi:hypothetical protein
MTDASKFTAPHLNEELHQGMEVPVTFSIDPTDRMPVPHTPENHDVPAPLAVDTFVCMEDKREFVIRNSDGSVWVSFKPEQVARMPNGEYYVTKADLDLEAARKSDWEVSFAWLGEKGLLLSTGAVNGHTVIAVEPIRPRCVHYLRVLTDISADRSRRFLTRACMKQQSDSGEYYSVGDSAIYACGIREPRHQASEEELDRFDDFSMQESVERQKASAFDVDAELAKEKTDLGILG